MMEGPPLTGYKVECLFFHTKGWLYEKTVKKDTTSHTCGDLREGDRYTFRVYACNKKGRSEKLETDEAVEPRRVIGNISALT